MFLFSFWLSWWMKTTCKQHRDRDRRGQRRNITFGTISARIKELRDSSEANQSFVIYCKVKLYNLITLSALVCVWWNHSDVSYLMILSTLPALAPLRLLWPVIKDIHTMRREVVPMLVYRYSRFSSRHGAHGVVPACTRADAAEVDDSEVSLKIHRMSGIMLKVATRSNQK